MQRRWQGATLILNTLHSIVPTTRPPVRIPQAAPLPLSQGSFQPTLCEYSTHCRNCGFREHTNVIVSDDSCPSSLNGICEDGGTGSSFFAETEFGYGGVTHLCGLGTDV